MQRHKPLSKNQQQRRQLKAARGEGVQCGLSFWLQFALLWVFLLFLGMFFRFVMFVFGLLVLATGISTLTALRRESPGFQSGDERRDTV